MLEHFNTNSSCKRPPSTAQNKCSYEGLSRPPPPFHPRPLPGPQIVQVQTRRVRARDCQASTAVEPNRDHGSTARPRTWTAILVRVSCSGLRAGPGPKAETRADSCDTCIFSNERPAQRGDLHPFSEPNRNVHRSRAIIE